MRRLTSAAAINMTGDAPDNVLTQMVTPTGTPSTALGDYTLADYIR